MIKRSFLLLFSCICLCVNAWGIDWVRETISTDFPFAICNAKDGLFISLTDGMVDVGDDNVAFWNFTSTSSTTKIRQNPNTSRTLKDGSDHEKDWKIDYESNYNSSGPAYRFWRDNVGRHYARSNSGSFDLYYTWSSATGSDVTWFLYSRTQYNNHVALDKYFALNASITSYYYPAAYKTTTNYSDLPLNKYSDYADWLLEDDNSADIETDAEVLRVWFEAAEPVRIAYANALDCVAKISTAGYTGTTPSFNYNNVSDINDDLNTYRNTALASLMSTTFVSKEVSFMLDNPDFELSPSDEYWDYGWSGTTDALNDGGDTQMTAFQKNEDNGNTYAWMNQVQKSGKHLNDGDIYQNVTLPAGVYKLSASRIANGNSVSSTLYVKNSSSTILASITMSDNGTFATQSLYFTLDEEETVTIGTSHTASTNNKGQVAAVDNFQLFIKNEIVNGDLTNTTTSSADYGWTTIAHNSSDAVTSWTNATNSGTFEMYEGDSHNINDYTMSQDVYLPTGYYKLAGNSFFRKHNRDNDDGRTSEAVLFAGSDEVPVLPLRRSKSHGDSGGIDNLSAATTALNANPSDYTNELYFQVASAGIVNLGYRGEFGNDDPYRSWFAAGPVSLTRLGNSYSQSVTVSAAGWATICLPYKADIPDGVTAYYVSAIRDNGDGTKSIVVTKTSGTVAAYEPLIINASAGSYTFAWSDEDASAIGSSNKLSGTYAPMEFENSEVFVLGYDSKTDAVFFGPLKNGEATYDILPANKAYLDASLIGEFEDPSYAPSRISFIFESENNTTGTEKVSDEINVKKIFRNGQVLIMRGNEMFDVMGRRVF